MKRARRRGEPRHSIEHPGSADVLRPESKRDTVQRRVVLDAFSRVGAHVSREELLIEARSIEPRIGAATVDRTLRILVEQGLAIARHFEGHVTRYERATAREHHHLICRMCGAIVDFEEPRLDRLQEQVAARHDFDVQAQRHELYGVCARCREGRAR